MSTKATYIPNIMRAMQDINSGAKKVDDYDWKKELVGILQFWNLIPMDIPSILWMWGVLGIIEDPNVRLSVLKNIKSKYYACYREIGEIDDFHTACRSLQHLYERMVAYNEQHRQTTSYRTGKLKELASIMSDDTLEGNDLVDLANEIYLEEIRHDNIPNPILGVVLNSYYNREHYCIDNVASFITYLYIAEGYRQLILSNNIDSTKLPEVKSIPRKIKKMCFDTYIERRIFGIREGFEYDEKRIEDPTDIECYQKLLKEETQHLSYVKIANTNWNPYPNRNIVIELSEQYIKYLQKIIDDLEKESKIEDLMGAKTVKVAMGDIVNTKIVQK